MVCGGFHPEGLQAGAGKDRKPADPSPGKTGAWAAGKDGGKGKDIIRNDGTRMVVTIADRRGSDVSTTVEAKAVGIDGRQSREGTQITQAGSVEAAAPSRVHSTGVSLASEGVPGSTETLIEEGGLASIGITSATALTAAKGLDGGAGTMT